MGSPIYAYAGQMWALMHAEYLELVEGQYLQAEEDTRGWLLNKRGQADGVDPRSLFSGPARRALLYASDELIDWWSLHARVTLGDFEATWWAEYNRWQEEAEQERERAS